MKKDQTIFEVVKRFNTEARCVSHLERIGYDLPRVSLAIGEMISGDLYDLLGQERLERQAIAA